MRYMNFRLRGIVSKISWIAAIGLSSALSIPLRAEDCKQSYPNDKIAQCKCECNNTFRTEAGACQGTAIEKNKCVILAAIKNNKCQNDCTTTTKADNGLPIVDYNNTGII